MINKQIPALFIVASLFALVFGLFFGVIGSLQYLFPELLKGDLNFSQTRPLHVTLVISWIFSAVTGGIYFYIQEISGNKIRYGKIALAQFILFICTGIVIVWCYLNNQFGGREYFEYPPFIAIPVLITWILFIINFFSTIKINLRLAPVYIWMWCTGLLFFLLTLIESYLWIIPFFRDNIVRDMTVQWKAMGSMVGSWNMLVYGTGFYIMEKISGDKKQALAPTTFFFYFLGLTNLMFNWGHHTYIVPASPYVKNIAYIISMTELLILGFLIRNWSKTLEEARKNYYNIPRRFIAAADFWIFLNLVLAIIISVPAINKFTHGTHITVAHAMGTTIGINSMILFASLFFIASKFSPKKDLTNIKKILFGFWITNISLLIFWISLMGSGIVKATESINGLPFQQVMLKLTPWFHGFSLSGYGILIGLILIAIPLISTIGSKLKYPIAD